MLVSGQGEGGVHDPPVTLQGDVPAADQSEVSIVTSTNHISPVAALVELLDAGDELVPVDAPDDGWQPVHQAHAVLGPRHLHAAHLQGVGCQGMGKCSEHLS